MKNKEVYINGVDISGCEFCDWKGSDIPQCRIRQASFEPTCKGYNCYFKQLKRKEQENEELRQYHNKCCNEENCNLLKGKEQKLVKIRQILYVYYGDDWKATREIERVLNGR